MKKIWTWNSILWITLIVVKEECLEDDFVEDFKVIEPAAEEFYNNDLDWFEPEHYEEQETPIKRKRGRPSKSKLEGNKTEIPYTDRQG